MIEENYDIEILYDGTWLHEGRPIVRHNLVKLFASVLKRDEAGDYWLITPAERGRIKVADVPFIAVEMQVSGAGKEQNLSFRTNFDDWVTAGPEHPLRMTNAPYVMVRGGMEARINRAVYYDLVALAEKNSVPDALGVWSGGVFFPLQGYSP